MFASEFEFVRFGDVYISTHSVKHISPTETGIKLITDIVDPMTNELIVYEFEGTEAEQILQFMDTVSLKAF